MTADALAPFAPRVDFVLGGVQKGGTTSLDRLLRAQPAVAMARALVRALGHSSFLRRSGRGSPGPGSCR